MRQVRSLLPRLARFPGSAALAAALNVCLRPALSADVRERLRGKRVEIAVTDWGMRLFFKSTAAGFVPLLGLAESDLRILATAHDFGALAAGEEDADTLYFNRRLVVEGDTELALLVKNTLDALEEVKARQVVRRLHRFMQARRER
ncbi:MAG TPA: SCP2 sterol-binding domain-containing protein, partial [Usitatibacter sp.]